MYHQKSTKFKDLSLPTVSTRITRMPAFWGYPPPPPMITHTIESYWIPSQKKTKSKLQIYRIPPKFQIFKFRNKHYTRHTSWNCLIRCANMKWIRWVLLMIQSRHNSVHRPTDGQGETSIPPFQLRWSVGLHRAWVKSYLYLQIQIQIQIRRICICICIWSNFKPCICICFWSTVFGVFDKYVFKYTFFQGCFLNTSLWNTNIHEYSL